MQLNQGKYLFPVVHADGPPGIKRMSFMKMTSDKKSEKTGSLKTKSKNLTKQETNIEKN